MNLLDDSQLKREATANAFGVKLENAVFKNGECVVSEVPRVVYNYDDLRWNVFHNFDPEKNAIDSSKLCFSVYKANWRRSKHCV